MPALRSTARTSLALVALLAVALGLRFAGLDRLLPHRTEPDAFVVLQMQELAGDPLQAVQSHYFERYPFSIAAVLSRWPAGPLPAEVAPAAADDEKRVLAAHLVRASEPFARVRAAVALCSALLAPLAYLLARRFLPPRAALAAGLLVTTSLLSLLFSQEARPHGITATLALASVLAALHLGERSTAVRWTLATLAAAAALASLQTGVFALPPLAVAGWLALCGRPWWKRWPAVAAPVAAALLAALFYSNRPYVDSKGLHLAAADQGGHSISPSDWNGLGFPRGAAILWEHDPLLAAAAAVGGITALFLALRRRRAAGGVAPLRGDRAGHGDRAGRGADGAPAVPRGELAIVLAYALPYALVIGLNGEIYERFLIPLLPYLALLGVLPLETLASRLRSPARIAALYALLLAFPAWAAVCWARAALGPDTQEQAARWIEEHAPREARVLSTWGLLLPLLNDPESLARNLAERSGASAPWLTYQRFVPVAELARFGRPIVQFPGALAFSKREEDRAAVEAYLDETRADFVVIEESPRRERWPMLSELHQAAERRGELVFRSRGEAPDPLVHDLIDYQSVRRLARRILSTRAFGPGVLVYRIRR